MNKVILMGRLTRDPVYTAKGDSNRVNFSIANNMSKDRTNFINVVAFKGWAKNFRGRKGDLVMVTGHLEQYKDKEGVERFSIVADSLMESKPKPKSSKKDIEEEKPVAEGELPLEDSSEEPF